MEMLTRGTTGTNVTDRTAQHYFLVLWQICFGFLIQLSFEILRAGNKCSKLVVRSTIGDSSDGYAHFGWGWLIDDPEGPLWFGNKGCIFRFAFLSIWWSCICFFDSQTEPSLGLLILISVPIQIARGKLWIYCSGHRGTCSSASRMYLFASHKILSQSN